MSLPWHAWLLLFAPGRVRAGLRRVAASGLVESVPTLWQIELGVLRMWHRILFRSETIGASTGPPPRSGLRARLLRIRLLRAPCLLAERAITPWDLSGFLSSPEQIVRHLLCAHHDGQDFVYDLQLLMLHPGWMPRLRAEVARVVERGDGRARWLQDLVVYEGYHPRLLAGIDAFLAGRVELSERDARDPDKSLLAYLRWCAAQPADPTATLAAWRAGRFTFPAGLAAPA
ncbi:MAG: hypothetical protein H6742_08590 [Alphaproteobacteria bacterium]|nr:hypothetical protein [Alphaproteobacteria bacterium]